MQNDDVIWQIINHQFCSFKSKIAKERTFCQNPYNVSGLCIRSACPLANSRYATIREVDGDCYLFVKTIERAHTPKNLWEKTKLPSNYIQALELVSKELEHFPKYLVHRNKQRLTKIHQMLIRMRKLKLKAAPKIVTTNTKIEQREKGKERKALMAAKLDRAIESELLERLRQATEGEIFNYPERQFNKVLHRASDRFQTESGEALEDPDMEDLEGDREIEQEEEDEEEEEVQYQYVEDVEESDDEPDLEDQWAPDQHPAAAALKAQPLRSSLRSAADKSSLRSKRQLSFEAPGPAASKRVSARTTRRARVEVEYEVEADDAESQRSLSVAGALS